MSTTDRAAIVQGDRSILVEVEHTGYEHARGVLARFAELDKAPEHMHTYRVSALSLWNAAAAGISAEEVVTGLESISRFPLPSNVAHDVRDLMSRHGICSLHSVTGNDAMLRLSVRSPLVRQLLDSSKKTHDLLSAAPDGYLVRAADRGAIKMALYALGYPTEDSAGLRPGEPLAISMADHIEPFAHQRAAADAFMESGQHGVVVLPCGAGKTVLSMMVMAEVGVRTLVLTTGTEASNQWRRELLDKTSLEEAQVAVYSSRSKDVGPVTLASYSMLARKGGKGPTGYTHFDRLAAEPWGLVVYDEVHLLPARVFRLTAELQATRRLGLTATLVREDGRAGDVFALIGPKRYDAPWRELEKTGHIAAATCLEVRVPLPASLEATYAQATPREQPRVAADNPLKLRALQELLARHTDDRVLIIGSYLDALESAARITGAPLITGKVKAAEREALYAAFRAGEIRQLILSRVGNFAIDLPAANVLIQLSGSMGSRQEEAQRLGRILRPKAGGATFYSLVTRHTVEQDYALRRQMFLAEQGYRYFIEDWTPHGEEEEQEVEEQEAPGRTLH